MWAAGLLEGEGCFVAYQVKYSKTGATYWGACVAMSMHQRDRDVIEHLQSILGGRIRGPYKSQRPGQGEMLNWSITKQNDCHRIGRLLLPYMGKRRQEQIKLMMERVETNKRFVYETGIDIR